MCYRKRLGVVSFDGCANGFGTIQNFHHSELRFNDMLIDYRRDHSIDDIIKLPDVKERSVYFEHEAKFKEQIKRCSTMHGNLVVLDLRNEEIIYAGNRFMLYALFRKRLSQCT